jgi:deoxyribonuclease V
MLSEHAWPSSLIEARRLQERLRTQIIDEDRLGPVQRIAGVDAHESMDEGMTYAAVAVLSFPELRLVETSFAKRRTDFPYIPGFLSFREAPVMLEALDRLTTRPDLLIVDGQGRAHPRRIGIASHVGLLSDLPAIGIGKSRLFGRCNEPGPKRGAWTPLTSGRETIGACLRTREKTHPVFVSVGHRVSLETAIDFALRCTPRYRISEPIRQADRLSRLHLAQPPVGNLL